MKFVSWNVNGLRACLGKGLLDFFNSSNADVFCLQETKMQEGQAVVDLPGYRQYWNSAVKKGYSGTAVFTRKEPLSVSYDIGDPAHVGEGRSITVELEDFYLVTVYTPNSKNGLARIEYRMEWEDAFRTYLCELNKTKPVVVCGDLNVAHEEIDLKNPGPNRGNAGFSDQERGKLNQLLQAGFTDTFRYLHPNLAGAYSWWSYRFRARENNAGWRIDYFLVSDSLRGRIERAEISNDIPGSDHCPVSLTLS